MKYRFQNHISSGACISVTRKTGFSTSNDIHRDYHPHYEIYFCKEYRAQNVTINGQSLSINTPSVILSAPFSIHSMFPADNEKQYLERHVIYFSETALSGFDDSLFPNELLKSFCNCIFPLTDKNCREILSITEHMERTDITDIERRLLLVLLLNTLHRSVPLSKRISYGTANYYIIEVLKYIHENLSNPITSDDIAAAFHVSRAKLDRDFGRFVGRSVRNAIIDCRIACACDMLSSSRATVKEIAALCGFESEYYFYSFFKRETGKTPLEWRKSERI